MSDSTSDPKQPLTRAQLRRLRQEQGTEAELLSQVDAAPKAAAVLALSEPEIAPLRGSLTRRGASSRSSLQRHPGRAFTWGSIRVRLLGVALAAALAVITITLWLNGQLALYVNPDSAWWVVSMSFVTVIAAVASCAVRVGDDHDHGFDADDEQVVAASELHKKRYHFGPVVLRGVGTSIAAVFVLLALLVPPSSLSTELALSRASGAPPRMSNSAEIALATATDASNFGIGEWSTLMATTTDPVSFVGEDVSLTGFVGPVDAEKFALTRLVIVHCVIDAQAAQIPVALPAGAELPLGAWVEINGQIALGEGNKLFVEPSEIVEIPEPSDPYEY